MTASPSSVRHMHKFSSTALHPAPRIMFSGLNVDDDVVVDEEEDRSKS